MMKLHCLAYSRAIRVAWLLEDLGQDYELIFYDRTPQFLAPEALKKVHPLGKSPTLEDGTLMLTESATILRYVHETHGDGRFTPKPGTDDYWDHESWLDYPESSAAPSILAAVLAKVAGKDRPDDPRMQRELETHLSYIEKRLSGRQFLMGDTLTLADIQMSYMIALCDLAGLLRDRPAIAAYWQRLQDQPGFKAATDKAGPMTPPFG
ncbi:glutathione S-transferase family protein [Amorphus orientalis]|uniref:Glutathione S-transferase n=1 Tax=Amorphus orientalis TaxID=649198 RepID=A0AAE4AQV6_9HYPH|nr:glutathione S-transferase family protein [Amorphus orientalis]MDQ0314516.1 glutathione S-transferase [Amorphus orientalis]